MFFNALTEIYAKGDRNGKLLAFPKHKILLDTEWDQNESFYSNIYDEIVNMGNPIFLNYSLPWVKEKGYFGPFFTNSQRDLYLQQIDELDLYDWSKTFVNTGGLQSISINLPRIAYEANGDDNKVIEILNERMDLVKGILLIKFNIIKKLIEKKQLPLCSGIVKGQSILNLKRQALVFGIVGLNEMISAHTGKQIHEDQSSQMLANKIIKHIIDRCNNYTKEHSIFFTLWEQPNEFAPYRFAALDLTHHNQHAKNVINGDLKNGSVYYTSSIGVNIAADIELGKKMEIYSKSASIFQNNNTLQLWLSAAESNKDPKKIQMTIAKLLENKINWFSLNSDFSMCPECYHFMKNSQQKCVKCGYDNKEMKVFSKITDYFSPVELWNPGKKQEFLDRKRISL
jgi:ribonucleoside-triphosphate reductase